jgi:hypothetical protein
MKLRAGALAAVVFGVLGGPVLLLPTESAGAAPLSLPLVYTCTAADTIAPPGCTTVAPNVLVCVATSTYTY